MSISEDVVTGRKRALKLGIASLGTIGLSVARRVDAGDLPGFELAAVAARDLDKARRNLEGFRTLPQLAPPTALADACDVVVECAPAALFREIAESVIGKGRIFVPLSVGRLLEHMELVDLARRTGARIIVPTGALLGLDAVKAVAEGSITSIRMTTRKPPKGLAGAPHLVANAISIDGLTEPKKIFSGSAREAARGFPANVNVAAALALAGIGPDRTEVEIWADPTVRHNTHTIAVTSDSSDFTMTIQNIPSVENPATGRITALSVIATLRRLTAPLVVGT
ncbi:MAG: aspartate dehydrogenase [Hyphomicrobiaceae bacterium]